MSTRSPLLLLSSWCFLSWACAQPAGDTSPGDDGGVPERPECQADLLLAAQATAPVAPLLIAAGLIVAGLIAAGLLAAGLLAFGFLAVFD